MHLLYILVFFICSIFSIKSYANDQKTLMDSKELKSQTKTETIPDSKIYSGKLENGLRYFILRNTIPKQAVSIRFLVNFGSLDEKPGERGLAHFIEHMAFNGTRHFPEGKLESFFKDLGIHYLNDTAATTFQDHTVYKLDLTSNHQKTLEKILLVLRDFADGIQFEPNAVEQERGVVLAEMLDRESRKIRYKSLYQDILKLSKKANYDPVGIKTDVEHADKRKLEKLYHHYYAPDNSVLMIIGDIHPDEIEKQIKDQFSSWKRKSPKRNRLYGFSEVEGKSFLEQVPQGKYDSKNTLLIPEIILNSGGKDTSVEFIQPFLPIIPETEEGILLDLSEYIAHQILKERLKSRIMDKFNPGSGIFIHQGAAQQTYLNKDRRYRSFYISSPAQYIYDVITLFEYETRRINKYGFSEKEIIAEKQNILNSINDQKDDKINNIKQIEELHQRVRFDRIKIDAKSANYIIKKRIDEINSAFVHQAFLSVWKTPPVIDINGIEGTSQSEINGRVIKAYQVAYEQDLTQYEKKPEPGINQFSYTASKEPGKIKYRLPEARDKISRMVLSNNIRVNIYHIPDFQETHMITAFKGGLFQCDGNNDVLPYLGSFPLMGLKQHSYQELVSIFHDRKSSFSFYVGEDEYAFKSLIHNQEFSQETQLLNAYIQEPGWRTEWVDAVKNHLPNLYAKLFSNKREVFEGLYYSLLFKNNSCTKYQNQEDVEKIDIHRLKTVLEPVLSKSVMDVSIVSGLDKAEIEKKILSSFATLPERNKESASLDKKKIFSFPKQGKNPDILYHFGEGQDSLAAVFWSVDLSDVNKQVSKFSKQARKKEAKKDKLESERKEKNAFNEEQLQFLPCWYVEDFAQSMRDYIEQNLREKDGATYHVGAKFFCNPDVTDYSFIGLVFDVSKDQLEHIFQRIDDLAKAFKNKGSVDMVNQSLDLSYLNFQRLYREDVGSILKVVSQAQKSGGIRDFYTKKDTYYHHVTAQQIQTLARKTLQSSKAWRLLVEPGKDIKHAHQHNQDMLNRMNR